MQYLVLDFEAMCHAGYSPIPTEIACCLIDGDGRVHDTPFFSELICPERGELTPYDTALTGITPAMLADARSTKAVFADLRAQCKQLGAFRVIAHNAAFDRGIALRYADDLGPLLLHPWLDTLRIAKQKLLLSSYSLDPVAEALGLSIVGQRHRAYPDAHLTAKAFMLLQAMPDCSFVQPKLL